MEEILDTFQHRSVQVFKSQSLGVGPNGTVYKAMCGEFPCAAKLLHRMIFQSGAQRCFEKEYQCLSHLRHPHIVLYLGTGKDPESGHPTLFMELMDESLTEFLEQSQDRLPYYLEVNICYDVALALAYLHSNNIIHRDLSSNNVLMIAGQRAKVTDFGMSKLLDATGQITPQTRCLVYMPPEALRNPSTYTDKLDCFSNGVLTIQIMTRQFPTPIKDPQSPTSMPIPEPECRKSHIDLIDPNHPLLPGAIQCLSYNEDNRPSAKELCNHLSALKGGPLYSQSMEQVKNKIAKLNDALEAKDKRIAEMEREVAVYAWDLEQLQAIDTASHQVPFPGEASHQVPFPGEASQQTQEDVERLTQQLEDINTTLAITREDNQELRWELKEKNSALAMSHHTNRQLRKELEHTTTPGTILQENQKLRQELREMEHLIEVRERQVRDLSQQLRTSEEITAEFQQTILNNEEVIRTLHDNVPTRETHRPSRRRQNPVASSAAVDTIKLSWKRYATAPQSMARGSVAVDVDVVYFRSRENNIVYAYDSSKEEWSKLPDCPTIGSGLVVLKGLLTAVGGKQSGSYTNILLSLTKKQKKWTMHYPPMPSKRWGTAVVCSGRSLVVAGGRVSWTHMLTVVEVMDIETHHWFSVRSLPHPLSDASAMICGEKLCLVRDEDQKMLVLTCSIDALLQSLPHAHCRSRPESTHIWETIAPIPVHLSTCTSLCGQLVAVGGYDLIKQRTTAIHVYNRVTNSWEVTSHMHMGRTLPLVAVIPGNRLMVVGGERKDFEYTDAVEISTSVLIL